jgi:hypothetical protein
LGDEAFAVVGDRPRYVRDGVERLQAHLRQLHQYSEAFIAPSELLVVSSNADQATESQWCLQQELQALLPDASITLRIHRLMWKVDPEAPPLTQFGVLVAQRVGPFTLRREYLASEKVRAL